MRVGIDPRTAVSALATGPAPTSTRQRLRIRRVYDQARGNGDRRVLVDRLWPRGVSRSDAALDEWLREVAPTAALRRWYGHDLRRFDEFSRRYRAELAQLPASEGVDHILELARSHLVTLLTATRDVEHSAAQVLFDHLRTGSTGPPERSRSEQ